MKPGPQSDLVLLEHMLSCLEAIRAFHAGVPRRYLESRLLRDAILRNLQTLTESSQRLSEPLKAEYPEIPWKKLAGFRNLLVHDYLGGIDDETVVLVIESELVPLEAALRRAEASIRPV